MPSFDFRVLLETVEGNKLSYYSNPFIDTDDGLILSASEAYAKITGSLSCSYQNQTIFSGSNINPNKPFKNNLLLSASLTGSLDTGSIVLTAKVGEYDRLLRYKFFGEKVCNTLGLPSAQWVYVDKFRLPSDENEVNIFEGNVKADNLFIGDTLTFANDSTINSDIPFLINTGSDRHIKFIDERNSGTLGMIIGYDKNLDTYEISGSTENSFSIGGLNKLVFADGTEQVTAGGGSGGTITALNNKAENRLVTIGSTTTELDGEANLTFDGTDLTINGNVFAANITASGDISMSDGGRVGFQPDGIGEGTDIGTTTTHNASSIQFHITDGEAVVIDNNRRVGIGNSNPAKPLTVTGDISSSGDIFLEDNKGIQFGQTSENFISGSSNDIVIAAYDDIFFKGLNMGTEILHIRGGESIVEVTGTMEVSSHITASGNISASGTIESTGNISTVGSITATSADINGAVDIDGGNLTVGTALQLTNGGVFNFGSGLANGRITWDADYASLYGLANKKLRLGSFNTQGVLTISSSHENTMVISGSNVGIGTTSPLTPLHIKSAGESTGGIRFQNTHDTVNMFFVGDDNDEGFQITYVGTGGAEIELQADGDLLLNASNGDNVGIGTTTPSKKLEVAGDISASGNLFIAGAISASSINTTIVSSSIVFLTGSNALIEGNITASNNISSSGTIIANALDINGASNLIDLTATGDVQFQGGLRSDGDFDLTNAAIDIDLTDNNASALSFDTNGKAGILELVTTNDSEKVKMSGGLEVTGNTTFTAGITASGNISMSSGDIFMSDGGSIGFSKTQEFGDGDDVGGRIRFNASTTQMIAAEKVMVHAADGKVGIFTETPQEVLTVQGNISASGKLIVNSIQFGHDEVNFISASGANADTIIGSADNIIFKGNGSDQIMEIQGDEAKVNITGSLEVTSDLIIGGAIAASGIISSSNQLPSGIFSSSAAGSAQGQFKLNGVDIDVNGLGTNGDPTFDTLTLDAGGLKGVGAFSSSAQLPSGIISSSAQIVESLPFGASGIFSSSTQLPSGIFSSSLQTFTNITASGDIRLAGDISMSAGKRVGFRPDQIGEGTDIGTTTTHNASSIQFHITDGEAVVIDNNRRVGIGNSNPAKPLTVTGDISSSGDIFLEDNKGIQFGQTSENFISGSSNDIVIAAYDDIFFKGLNMGTEILHIRGGESIVEVTGTMEVSSHITSSGNISSSGEITGLSGSFGFGIFNTSVLVGQSSFAGYGTVNANTNDLIVNGQFSAAGSAGSAIYKLQIGDTLGIPANEGDLNVGGDLTIGGAIVASGILSSSTQLPSGIISSSAQIVESLPFGASGIISSSNQLPTGIISSSNQLPTGIISSSLHTFTAITSSGNISMSSGDIFMSDGGSIGFSKTQEFGDGDDVGGRIKFNASTTQMIAAEKVMVHAADGKVGIFTDTPNEVLEVKGNISASGKLIVDDGIQLGYDNVNFISASGANADTIIGAADDIVFKGNGSDTIARIRGDEAQLLVTGDISASGVLKADTGISSSGRLTVDGVANFGGSFVNIGGGFGSTGVSISDSGNIQADGDLTIGGAIVASGIISSSAQVVESLPFGASGIISGAAQLPSGIFSSSAAGSSQGKFKLNGVDIDVNGLGTDGDVTFDTLILDAGGLKGVGAFSSSLQLTGENLNLGNITASANISMSAGNIFVSDGAKIGYSKTQEFGDGDDTESAIKFNSANTQIIAAEKVMVHATDGKVGIFTETPNEVLQVHGNISASGNIITDGGIQLGHGNVNFISASINDTIIGSADDIIFKGNGSTEIARIRGDEAELLVTGKISASGDISSSGKIIGDDFEFNLPTVNERKFRGLTNVGVRLHDAAGGWAMSYGFQANGEEDLGGFGAFGGGSLEYFFIGNHYQRSVMTIHSGSNNGVVIGDGIVSTVPTVALQVAGDISASGDLVLGDIAGGNYISASAAGGNLEFTGAVSGSASSTFTIGGKLQAGSKSFLIARPEGGKLEYGALEGQQNDVFYRGELKGDNVIHLPKEWEWLVDENTITVQLTSIGKHQELFVKEIKENKIFININGICKGKNNIHCYYIIHGTRKDVELIRNYQ